MENTERQKFEESWKEAFEGQEMDPSDSVWNNIDLKLDNDKMKRRVIFYQRLAAASVLFALLIGIGGTRYYNRNQRNDLASATKVTPGQEQITESTKKKEKVAGTAKERTEEKSENESDIKKLNPEEIDSETKDRLTASSQSKNQQESISEAGYESRKQNNSAQVDGRIDQQQLRSSKSESIASSSKEGNKVLTTKSQKASSESANKDDYTASVIHANQIAAMKKEETNSGSTQTEGAIADPGIPLPLLQATPLNTHTEESRLAQNNGFSKMSSFFSPQLKNKELPKEVVAMKEEKRVLPEMPASLMTTSSKDKKTKENTWLSFGAAAGSYNPGNSSSSYTTSSSLMQSSMAGINNQSAPQSNTRSSVGSAYSVGLSFGKKVAERWIVQTGVNYMNQAISFTSNYATYTASNDRAAFVADYADKTTAPLSITQPYKVNSSMEFVSVPVQAGYLLIDRKLALQWNAGVATDIFLRNTLKDQSGKSARYTQGSGADSPYRALNMAALTSTEISYKMGRQYRLSLVPGVRYSFQSALKSQSGTGNPLIMDIGFRFRYIFE